jgi:4-hydroxy-tetrahydrodipicolinate synthase
VALLNGVFAAAITPRRDGEIDLGATLEVIDFLIAAKVEGLALFTPAGEPLHFTAADRLRVLNLVTRRTRLPVAVGISASNGDDAAELVAGAVRMGVAALLVSPPYLYRHRQSDLYDFYLSLAPEAAGVPLLIHNSPDFTEPLTPATAAALLNTGLIAGIAAGGPDGQFLPMVRALAPGDWTAAAASDEAWLDERTPGVISPVACAVPELIKAIQRGAPLEHRLREFLQCSACLTFPAPVREALSARKVKTGPHTIPPSAETQACLADFRDWFRTWLPQVQREARDGK